MRNDQSGSISLIYHRVFSATPINGKRLKIISLLEENTTNCCPRGCNLQYDIMASCLNCLFNNNSSRTHISKIQKFNYIGKYKNSTAEHQ